MHNTLSKEREIDWFAMVLDSQYSDINGIISVYREHDG